MLRFVSVSSRKVFSLDRLNDEINSKYIVVNKNFFMVLFGSDDTEMKERRIRWGHHFEVDEKTEDNKDFMSGQTSGHYHGSINKQIDWNKYELSNIRF